MNKQILRHLQAIIAGNNVARHEIKTMYLDALRENVTKRVNQFFAGNNIEQTIQYTIRKEVLNQVAQMARKADYGWSKSDLTRIEKMVHDEVSQQVKELVRNHVRIEVVNQEVLK